MKDDTDSTRGRWRGLFWVAWLPGALLFSAWVAGVYGYQSIWGGSSDIFLDYALPIPLATGTLHWPSLVAVGILVSTMIGAESKTIRNRAIGLLIVFAIGVAMLGGPNSPSDYLYAVTSPRMTHVYGLNRNPLALFVLCDAVLGSLVAMVIALRSRRRT